MRNRTFLLLSVLLSTLFIFLLIDPGLSPANVSDSESEIDGQLLGSWSAGANIITPTYFGTGVSYTRNDTGWLFVIGGNAPSASNIVQRYNVNTNTWALMTPLPYNIVVNGSAQLKDSVYSFGGYLNGSSSTTNFYRYDIRANSWTARAPLPASGAFCKGVGYQDSLIYVCQGYNGSTVTATVWLYNANSNSWRTCSPMPAPRFGGAFARSGDTLMYFGGGDLSIFYNTTFKGVISQIDRSVITWTTGATVPGTATYRYDAHNWGCKGVIMTIPASPGPGVTTCWVYSPGSNQWTQQPNKPTSVTSSQSGSVKLAGNIWKLVCASGYTGSVASPVTEIFTDTLCPLPQFISSTICRNGINVAVPNATTSGVRDTIRMIGNTNCTLVDINVKIDTFVHTWISDMQFTLNHNGSTPVSLFLNRGGSGDNIINCIFNDSALLPISSGVAPFTGQWRPEQPLSAYNGQSPAGNWILHMVDPASGDLGFLRAWCVILTYSCPLGGVKTIQIPASYRLYQNYPNPFNPVTTIKYGLPKSSDVKLVIYDVLGKEIVILVNEHKSAGTYEVNWDASDFASGIYFYVLEVRQAGSSTGDYKSTKKMLLVK